MKQRAPDGDATKKRTVTSHPKEEDLAQEQLQQQNWFQDFAIDYSLWYIANTHQEVGVRHGLVLIHKPTYLPFIVLADLPVEEDDTSTVYSFYTHELGTEQGAHHALVPADQAAEVAPVIFRAAHESYLALGAVSPQHGDTLRGRFVTLVFGRNTTAEEEEPRQRRILTVRRGEDAATMSVDNK